MRCPSKTPGTGGQDGPRADARRPPAHVCSRLRVPRQHAAFYGPFPPVDHVTVGLVVGYPRGRHSAGVEREATRHPRAPGLRVMTDSHARAGVGRLPRPFGRALDLHSDERALRGAADGRICRSLSRHLARWRPAGHRHSLRGRTGARTVVASAGLVERAAPTAPVGEAALAGPHLANGNPRSLVGPRLTTRHVVIALPFGMEASGSTVAPSAVEPARERWS